ncbi:protein BIG GRAIN 1-like [Typha latifolia]|uniref:protein BIG GRAIN 1-like n=1 Tax=Typha latifolia TaxID=4733 RepID=UPI003C307F74
MDRRWDRRPPPLPPPLVRQCPSFSASLLDAIYRSLDADAGMTDRDGGAADPPLSLSLSLPSPSYTPRKSHAVTTPRAISTSSDASSFGFSSSDGGDPSRNRLNRIRVRIRPDQHPPTPVSTPLPDETTKKKKKEKETKKKTKTRSIRTRLYDLKKGPAPSSSSTSAPLACLLKAIFSSAGHLKRGKATTSPAPEPACSSARSCLSSKQKPPTPAAAKRSVRFSPVNILVGEDSRPCGQRCLDGADTDPPPSAAEKEVALSSDSSSDLFELENLTAIGWDELPALKKPNLIA